LAKASTHASQSAAAGKKTVPPSREGKRAITMHQPDAVRRQLKLMAAEQDRTIDDLCSEALNLLFAKHRKPQIAPRKPQR
jgi:hypothetical protein